MEKSKYQFLADASGEEAEYLERGKNVQMIRPCEATEAMDAFARQMVEKYFNEVMIPNTPTYDQPSMTWETAEWLISNGLAPRIQENDRL
jgi:hypothetical protein